MSEQPIDPNAAAEDEIEGGVLATDQQPEVDPETAGEPSRVFPQVEDEQTTVEEQIADVPDPSESATPSPDADLEATEDEAPEAPDGEQDEV